MVAAANRPHGAVVELGSAPLHTRRDIVAAVALHIGVTAAHSQLL
eukprot:COSAG01_NODE_8458_length_2779_cov_6.544128_4_plen_45_part_00